MKFRLAAVTVPSVAVLALSGLCLAISLSYAQSYAQDDTGGAPPSAADSAGVSEDTAPAPAPTRHGGEFSYSVRPGDSLGSISTSFGIQAADIAHANRIDVDSTLMVGQTLRIPNPFAARMRELTAENRKLSDQIDDLRKRSDNATAAEAGLFPQV
jgi:LysM repeat protein